MVRSSASPVVRGDLRRGRSAMHFQHNVMLRDEAAGLPQRHRGGRGGVGQYTHRTPASSFRAVARPIDRHDVESLVR
jgi:hypothetical protein